MPYNIEDMPRQRLFDRRISVPVQMEQSDHTALKREARTRGISVAAVIRAKLRRKERMAEAENVLLRNFGLNLPSALSGWWLF